MLDTDTTVQFYSDLAGKPLQGGKVYFGVAGQNPTTGPLTVYWDAAGTQPAAQPISIAYGLATRNGAPARVYIPSDYSKLVNDSAGRIVSFDSSLPAPLRSGLAASGGSALMGFLQAGASAAPRTVQDKLREYVSITDFGAVAGDTGDQTADIQLALNVGKSVYVPDGTFRLTGSATLIIPANTRLHGPGKLHCQGVNICMQISGDYATIDGLTIYGDNTGLYQANNIGIFLDRTAGGVVTFANRPVIKNCFIYGFGSSGIFLNRTYDALVSNNLVTDCGVHGICLLSPIRAKVDANQVNRVQPGGPGGIGYGIQFTRDNTVSLANAPMPINCAMTNNLVTTIPVYAGLDCHSGQNITISGNTVDECTVGLDLSHATGGGDLATITNLTITGNTFRASGTQPHASGVLINAESGAGEIARGITISGNNFSGFGVDPGSPFLPTVGGVIYASSCDGVTITGNTFVDCIARCVSVYSQARGVICNSNVVLDLAALGGVQEAFSLLHTTGQMTADGNIMLGASGAMYHSAGVDNTKGLKAGAGNIVQGGATLTTTGTKANMRGGGYIMEPRVMVGWNAAGTIQWSAFEDINYFAASVTITKNGTGDFTIAWPVGIFDVSSAPIFVAKDPAAGAIRTQIVTTDTVTSARCLSFDSGGVAIDCAENALMVWGR